MITNLSRTGAKRLCQHVQHLVLLEQLQHAHAEAIEVLRLAPQVDRLRVCFQRVHDARRERRRHVQRHERLGRRGRADGKHFGEPQRQLDARPGTQCVASVVVQVAEAGDVELKSAGHFLLDVSRQSPDMVI